MRNVSSLPGFGQQLHDAPYHGWLSWIVTIRPVNDAWMSQPSYLLSECTCSALAAVTLLHAVYLGGRWPSMWLGSLIHGLVVQTVCMNVADVENYWHSQSTIVLLGHKLPLHALLMYPVMQFPAHVAVAHLRLPRYAQAIMAGLLQLFQDVPYDMVGVRFLHWTWHDTDPNVYDRHYWVPWNCYYFHLTFGAGYYFCLQLCRRVITGTDSLAHHTGVRYEVASAVIAGWLGVIGGVIQFIPLYHPLHDLLGVHSEITLVMLVVFYTLLVWAADRKAVEGSRKPADRKNRPIVLTLCLLVHFSTYCSIAAFFNPEDEVSIGLHERVGPCDVYQDVLTAFAMKLKKRKYLCATDYDEGYFDFSCVPGGQPPVHGIRWYTICGVGFSNRSQYVALVWAASAGALIVFHQCLYRSGPQVLPRRVKIKPY